MHLVNLQIDKIIIHQIYQKTPAGETVAPTQSHELINFDTKALEAFKSRVREALGADSKAVQMLIEASGPKDLPSLVDNLIEQDAVTFAVSSFDLARLLTKAQFSKGIPGGVLAVFTGTQGVPAKRFLGIIKAEIYSAYEKIINPKTKQISLEFIEEVLLTPSTKLYKTAGFFENSSYDEGKATLNEKWSVMVSDNQISNSELKAAAQYFYQGFLGLGHLPSSARTTKLFYEKAKDFIGTMDISSDKKVDLMSALTVYLKVDNSQSISTSDFSKKYFDTSDIQDSFGAFMVDAGLPAIAFTKDIKHIANELKVRKVKFGSGVSIRASSEAFQKLVTITPIEGDVDESGSPDEWTSVLIKHKVTGQE